MIQELWSSFPRLIEQNINGLLDGALPNRTKAFMLYKTCKNEGLWKDSYEKFSTHLQEFFSRSKFERHKSGFDYYLERPMDTWIYADFHLSFRTAEINENEILKVASWAHNLMRVSKKTRSVVISLDVMTRTLRTITNPPQHGKTENIEFEDFCSVWKRTVFKLFGRKYDPEFYDILVELNQINQFSKAANKALVDSSEFTSGLPTVLSPMELNWTTLVRKATLAHSPLPKFPLIMGPQREAIADLQRVAALYELIQSTRRSDLLQHKTKVYSTIIDRCDRILAQNATPLKLSG